MAKKNKNAVGYQNLNFVHIASIMFNKSSQIKQQKYRGGKKKRLFFSFGSSQDISG